MGIDEKQCVYVCDAGVGGSGSCDVCAWNGEGSGIGIGLGCMSCLDNGRNRREVTHLVWLRRRVPLQH